jgi:small subunit ribosomal protein S20
LLSIAQQPLPCGVARSTILANTLSAEKRARQSDKRYARNRWYRGRANTFTKRARRYIAAGNVTEAEDAVRRATQALDRAASKGTIHRNKAARTKSRLMRALHKLQTL